MRLKPFSLKNASMAMVMFAMMLGTASAQDTVFSLTPKSTYFYNGWPQMDTSSWFLNEHGYGVCTFGVDGLRFCFEPGEEVNVYGIAAGLQTWDLEKKLHWHPGYIDSANYYEYLSYMVDTTADSAYDYWGIYKHEGEGLVLASPQLKVNIKTSPVAYYWDINAYDAILPPHEKILIPMYEMYFNEPQVVTDSFYLGMSGRIRRLPQSCVPGQYWSWPIFWSTVSACIGPNPYDDPRLAHFPPATRMMFWIRSGKETWLRVTQDENLYFIFPILEPDSNGYFCEVETDTTTVEPGDTTLAVQRNVLWRSTVVLPNPACTEARVVSGVGLTQVEAFDAAGTLVATVRAEGNETTLDVSAWPAGTYLLRLTTPLGSTTKKLVVQRR